MQYLLAAAITLAWAACVAGLAGRDVHLSNDAVEYLTLGDALAQGRGPLLPVKGLFFSDEPLPINAVGERPLLYPLLLALGQGAAVPPLYVNLLAAGAAVVLLFVLASRTCGALVGWCSLALMLGYANFWNCAIHAWPDTLYSFFLVAGALAVSTASRTRMAWSGAAFACAALTRPEGLGVSIVVFVALLARHGRPALIFLMGLCIVMLPQWIACGWVRGNPLYSMHANHFRVLSMFEGIERWPEGQLPTVASFVSTHGGEVLRRVLWMEGLGLWHLCANLGLVTLGLGALLLRRPELRDGLLVLLTAGLTQQIGTHLLWASTTPFDPKYYVPVTTLLLVPALHGLSVTRRGVLPALTILSLAWQGLQWTLLVAGWPGTRAHAERDALQQEPSLRYLIEHTASNDHVAAVEPFIVCWVTARPTVQLPRLRTDQFDRFVRHYDVRYISLFGQPQRIEAFRGFAASRPDLTQVADGLWEVRPPQERPGLGVSR